MAYYQFKDRKTHERVDLDIVQERVNAKYGQGSTDHGATDSPHELSPYHVLLEFGFALLMREGGGKIETRHIEVLKQMDFEGPYVDMCKWAFLEEWEFEAWR